MTTHRRAPLARLLTTSAILAVVAVGLLSPPAAADDLVAADASAVPVAADRTTATASTATRAVASIPRGIVVLNTHGQPVKVLAKGEPIRRQQRLGLASTTFTGLTAGRAYTVVVGGRRLGAIVAVNRPGPASALSVRTTPEPGSVALSWRHRPTRATGGARISYDITAAGKGAPTLRRSVTGRRSAVLAGLDQKVLYTFTVTPRNSAGPGRPSRADMTRSLAQISGRPATGTDASVPTTPVPTVAVVVTPSPAPTPAPAPEPLPAPAPSTKTIYVCPDGYVESAAGACEKKLPYTFTTRPYTYHQEVTGPAPILESYETKIDTCPSGYNFEDYTWIWLCRRYGPAPTKTVKDATPSGFTDTGTEWSKRNPAPTGYTDNGTEWVKVVPKVARVVPA